MPVAKSDALSLLTNTRLQNILVSRASAVTACQYQYKDYVLPGDILFDFGRSAPGNINPEGHTEIARIAQELKSQGTTRVVVTGHTDSIGSPQGNLSLGLKRAETVRTMLLDEGIGNIPVNVMTAGSREPVASGCDGLPRQQKINCLAPDRRVVIRSYTD
jgi:Outer membrane protein and related peptidoglycan-associated (lipo)proteins